MDGTQARLKALIEKISAQLAEYDDVVDFAMPHELAGPATEAQIAEFERARGVTLPADYRVFLLMHNGWKGFSGDNVLFSLEEMSEGEYHRGIQGLQAELRRTGQTGPGSGLVFEGSLGTRMTYFDLAKPPGPRGPEVVFWDRGEVSRYPDFMAFLEDYSATLAEMIEGERNNLRGEHEA